MCDEKTINLFRKTFSNLKTVSWKGVYKQKNDFYRKIYFYLAIAIMILVISWNIMVKKCVVGYRSNYNGETTAPAFSFPKNHEDLKSRVIGFLKNSDHPLLYLLFISATLKITS